MDNKIKIGDLVIKAALWNKEEDETGIVVEIKHKEITEHLEGKKRKSSAFEYLVYWQNGTTKLVPAWFIDKVKTK